MKKYTIGIDIGGTNVKLGLVSPQGKVIARSRLVTKSFRHSRAKLISALANQVNQFIAENNLTKKQIAGLGIGLPGLINPQKGVVVDLTNIPGWKNVPLCKILKQKLRLPCFIDNDVNLITLGEWKHGAGKGCGSLVCITLGTGVGGGLILNNEIYRGDGYVAGEVGHIPYKDKTIELYVGNAHLGKRAKAIFKRKIALEEIFALANKGNKKAKKFWADVGDDVGTTMAGVINVLNPRLIIIGGGVSNNFKYLGPAIKKAIQSKALKVQRSMVKVVRAKLGDDAGIIGAKILVENGINQ